MKEDAYLAKADVPEKIVNQTIKDHGFDISDNVRSKIGRRLPSRHWAHHVLKYTWFGKLINPLFITISANVNAIDKLFLSFFILTPDSNIADNLLKSSVSQNR